MSRTVSVIIPAYNAAPYLPAALDAALAQSLAPHQVIVVDDGSTDDTPDVCRRYGDRILAIRQTNRGEAGARNTALDAATGEYIALLDADDLCAADRLEKQVAALETHSEAVACFSGQWVFTDAGETGRYPGTPERGALPPEQFAARLLVLPGTMMFRRERAAGLRFPVGVTTGGDMLFTGLLRRQGPFVVLPDVLYGYRRHPQQMTAKLTDLESLKQRVAWVRAHAAEQWPELDVNAFETLAWNALAEGVHGHYWTRRRAEFFKLRQVLRENWPAHLPSPPEARLRWYPDAVWKLKGLVDAARRRRASS